VRGVGLIAGIQLAKDKQTRLRFENKGEIASKVKAAAMDNGLIMRATEDSMVLSPPLTISRSEVDELIEAARASLQQTTVALGL
jgi:putrescine aminotransferase